MRVEAPGTSCNRGKNREQNLGRGKARERKRRLRWPSWRGWEAIEAWGYADNLAPSTPGPYLRPTSAEILATIDHVDEEDPASSTVLTFTHTHIRATGQKTG